MGLFAPHGTRLGTTPSSFSTVYEKRVDVAAGGEETTRHGAGEVPAELDARLRSPLESDGRKRSYAESIIVEEHEDGSLSRTHIISEFVADTDDAEVVAAVSRVVGPGVAAKIHALSDGDLATEAVVKVCGKVANFREQPFPAVPRRGEASEAQVVAAIAAQEAAAEANLQDFLGQSQGLRDAISERGEISGILPRLGWVCGTTAASQLEGISRREDIAHLVENRAVEELYAQFPLNKLRQPAYTQLNSLYNQGFEGETSKIGIIEKDGIEDEGCFLDDSNGCVPDERIDRKFRCKEDCYDWPPTTCQCQKVSNWEESLEGTHATTVASIALASFQENQQNPNTPPEPALVNWRNKATGFAREAEASFFAIHEGLNLGEAAAYLCAAGDHSVHPNCGYLDVTNESLGDEASLALCQIQSTDPGEDALELAFEAGVLPVVAAGNDGVPSDGCRVASPADTPLAVSVGMLFANDAADPYSDFFVPEQSADGGADGVFDGTLHSTVSLVDLVAPVHQTHFYSLGADANGVVVPEPTELDARGTSVAAPVVAGIAAVLKDRYSQVAPILNPSHTGRYATLLFSMADRATSGNTSEGAGAACTFGDKLRCGVDFEYGFGRVKVSHPNVWVSSELTFVEAFEHHITSIPLPADAQLAKCTLLQHEPMRSKPDLSRVELTARIVDKVGGSCVAGQGLVHKARRDDHYDYKHMVAILDDEVQPGGIGGKCLETSTIPLEISTDGYVRVSVFCSGNDDMDDAVD